MWHAASSRPYLIPVQRSRSEAKVGGRKVKVKLKLIMALWMKTKPELRTVNR